MWERNIGRLPLTLALTWDQESNPQPFSRTKTLQPTEQPGQGSLSTFGGVFYIAMHLPWDVGNNYCIFFFEWLDNHNLPSDPTDPSSTHLAPHLVITVLLTIGAMPYFTSRDCFVTTSLCLIPSPLSPNLRKPLPSGNYQFGFCTWVCSCFVCSFVL